MENGFCILRIPNIFSACGVWSTFVYRKQEHLAVGSWGKGLTDSRGSAVLSVALPSPFVPLLYHNLGGLSRGFYIFFRGLAPTLALFALTIWESLFHALSLPLTSLVYHKPHQKSRTFFKKTVADFRTLSY